MPFVVLCCGISLAELASAFPHSGGQYFWVSQLAPKMIKSFLSCTTAILSRAGAICNCASGALIAAIMVMGMAKLLNSVFKLSRWFTFLVNQTITLITFSFNRFEDLVGLVARGILLLPFVSDRIVRGPLIFLSDKPNGQGCVHRIR